MKDAGTLGGVMVAFVDQLRRSLRVCDVVQVVEYFPATQTADVRQVVLEERMVDEERTAVPAMTIKGCPVLWPAGSLVGMTMGLQAGDEVLALVRSRSHDEVDANTATEAALPTSTRRMDLADIVILPGFFRPGADRSTDHYDTDGAPVIYMPANQALLVGDSTADKALALAELVDARVTTLQQAHDSHTHSVVGTVTPTGDPVAGTASTTSPVGALASVACEDVKVRA